MAARKYVPKATQRCSRCDRRGHNSRSRNCPARLCDESVARGLVAFAESLKAASEPGAGGVVDAALSKVAASARAAADLVTR